KFSNLAEVDSLISIVTRSLRGDFNIQQVQADFQQFSGSAYRLYDFLIAPVFTQINMTQPKTNLIIVPDGNLSFIPFEALVEKRPATSGIAYNKLAYLVHQYAISYAFSTQVLVKSLRHDKSSVSALVFSYDEKNLATNSGTELSIKGTSEEAEFISSIMPTAQFSGSMATKSNFIKHSQEAGVIHMALHGRANPLNPLKWFIQFRKSDEPPGDDHLYYYELLNMQLKARLTVLSACETGVGEFMDVEGVDHIARGFRYAGCPTLVASLWKINDKSTAELVQYFYKNLMDEKEIANALQESKRQYLSTADEFLAHPRYWAGMVLIGNTDPLDLKASFTWGYWGIIGMVFLLLLVFVKLKYR